MLLKLHRIIKTQLQEAVKKVFDIELVVNEIVLEYPPKTEMGDLAFPIAFEIAKRLKAATGAKQNPRQLADKIRVELTAIEGVARVETAGAGYINFFLDRGVFFSNVFNAEKSLKLDEITGGKLIVEHTSINPNKAAHIGHVRNAVLGDTIVRMLKASGETVETHNYIDNTGVQVADVVVGFKYLEKKSLEEIIAITEQFDYYCWDLYAQVGKFYEESPENKQIRAQTLHEIEHNIGDTAVIAEHVSSRILKAHLDTMWRLGITYDVLPRESDVLHLNFWKMAFEKLKQQGAIYYETEGKNKGCWLMKAETDNVKDLENTENKETTEDAQDNQYDADKILVRSNGTVTYTGKDIAYHLWKLGQLGLDFKYRPFYTYPDGKEVFITTSQETSDNKTDLGFGNGVAYFNVIDVGQSYPQAYVKLGVKLLSTDDRIDRSAHLAYEKVVLTPASAKELGYELSEEDAKRTQVSMSGRKGLGVKADDLMTKMEEKARQKVDERYKDASVEERQAIIHKIMVSSLRYFLMKYTRSSIIAFDFEEALAFQGEAGPYVLYAVVRVNSIFRNLIEKGKSIEVKLTSDEINSVLFLKDDIGWDGNYLWTMIYLASRLSDVLRLSIASLEPTHLAKYVYQLAASFSNFYRFQKDGKDVYKIIDETDPIRYQLLVATVGYIRRQLEQALWILGIEPAQKM